MKHDIDIIELETNDEENAQRPESHTHDAVMYLIMKILLFVLVYSYVVSDDVEKTIIDRALMNPFSRLLSSINYAHDWWSGSLAENEGLLFDNMKYFHSLTNSN